MKWPPPCALMTWLGVVCLALAQTAVVGAAPQHPNPSPLFNVGNRTGRPRVTLVAQSSTQSLDWFRINTILLPSVFAFWDPDLGPLLLLFDHNSVVRWREHISSDHQQGLKRTMYRVDKNRNPLIFCTDPVVNRWWRGWMDSQYAKFYADTVVHTDAIGFMDTVAVLLTSVLSTSIITLDGKLVAVYELCPELYRAPVLFALGLTKGQLCVNGMSQFPVLMWKSTIGQARTHIRKVCFVSPFATCA